MLLMRMDAERRYRSRARRNSTLCDLDIQDVKRRKKDHMSSDRKAAMEEYLSAPWTVFELRVLFHHFINNAYIFPAEDAFLYDACIDRFREMGLIDRDRELTAKGVRFIAALCRTEIPQQ